MTWVHRITDKDTLNKMGNCSNCGPVEIVRKKNSWICLPGKRQSVVRSGQRRKYGRVLVDRPNSCSICDKEAIVCYDHDHATGEFRGWLCHGCNLALGNVHDSPEILRKLADYLEGKL